MCLLNYLLTYLLTYFTPRALFSPILLPYRTKHEVDRMARCRDMAIRNFPKREVGRSLWSVGRRSLIYTLFSCAPLQKKTKNMFMQWRRPIQILSREANSIFTFIPPLPHLFLYSVCQFLFIYRLCFFSSLPFPWVTDGTVGGGGLGIPYPIPQNF